MSFNLRKPPIVEGWISATTVPASESEWQWQAAMDLLLSYAENYPIVESLPDITLQPKGVEKGSLPKEIVFTAEPKCLRARNESRSRVVQVGRNQLLTCHGTNADEPYLGFQKLLADFQDALDRYRNAIPTMGIESIAIHYVDLVVIPGMYFDQLGPKDYFEGAPDFAEKPFGEMVSLSWSSWFSCPMEPDVAQLSVQTLPPDDHDGRFRLDWHYCCEELQSDNFLERIHIGHDYLRDCFRAVCKTTVWDLFDPQ